MIKCLNLKDEVWFLIAPCWNGNSFLAGGHPWSQRNKKTSQSFDQVLRIRRLRKFSKCTPVQLLQNCPRILLCWTWTRLPLHMCHLTQLNTLPVQLLSVSFLPCCLFSGRPMSSPENRPVSSKAIKTDMLHWTSTVMYYMNLYLIQMFYVWKCDDTSTIMGVQFVEYMYI